MKIEDRIAELEANIEELKEELNQQKNSKPKFKIGEVYRRKGHEGKYALTYLESSDTVQLINLMYGKVWKTTLSVYQDIKLFKNNKRSITWTEMQFLTGNKADEFSLVRDEPKYFIGGDQFFLRYNKRGLDLWHLVNEWNEKHPDLKSFAHTADLFWRAISEYELEITYD